MTYFLLLLFSLVCFWLLYWGTLKPGRIYEFPFLAGAVFTTFVLPQLIGLTNDPYILHAGLNKTIIMSTLSAGMCYIGYISNRKPMKKLNWSFTRTNLLVASIFFVVIGGFFFLLISRLSEELTEVSNWTGPPALYYFFATVLTYGFAIALLVFARFKTKIALGIVALSSVIYLDRILITGRRGDTLEFVLLFLLAFWFARRKVIPRALMLGLIFVGMLVINSIGEYRGITMGQQSSKWEEVVRIDFLDNFLRLLTDGGHELLNAVYEIEAADYKKDFDYGIFHWNTLVFNFVPAQILGSDFKSSLMVPIEDTAFATFGHVPNTGSTSTGITDSFKSFWYFGALKFFIIGFILSRLYRAAIQGHFTAQLLYMLIIAPALLSITHHTQWFISAWVHMGIFLFPVLLVLRNRNFRIRSYIVERPEGGAILRRH